MLRFSNARLPLAVAAWLIAGGAGFAADLFAQPYYAGGYAPAPNVAYQGYGQGYNQGYNQGYSQAYGVVEDAGGQVQTVYYQQGYYYGGYQYPAGGYGGGDYRRAAYSAADVYVGYPPPVHARPYAYPRAPWRPYAQGYAAPAGLYDAPVYRPHGGPRPRRQCRALY